MEIALRKGWLKVPGVQDGERTLEEQTEALKPAIAECAGKTVVDLGCSEGLIALQFLKAGASRALGIEAVHGHVLAARQLCRGYPIKFKRFNLKNEEPGKPLEYDIVLCLGIAHKMEFPEPFLRFAARSAKDLLLLRCGRGMVRGIISSKHYPENTCDSRAVMREEGFVLEKSIKGPPPHSEVVEYWRKLAEPNSVGALPGP